MGEGLRQTLRKKLHDVSRSTRYCVARTNRLAPCRGRLHNARAMRLATLLGPDLKQTLAEDPGELLEALEEFHAEDIAEVVSDLEDDVALSLMWLLP
jgi:hypothetical protein